MGNFGSCYCEGGNKDHSRGKKMKEEKEGDIQKENPKEEQKGKEERTNG